LNRLTDDQTQERVRSEAEAVEGILHLIREKRATWVSSVVLQIEISRNPNVDRRQDVESLLEFATETIVPQAETAARGALLHDLGFGSFDALHLAAAEQGRAEVFLTTDDNLLRRAIRYQHKLRVRVINPVSWYKETEI
jgi:hypothetical protein